MILGSIGPGAHFFRFHSPRWATHPLSGEGAAQQGGRFNRPGLSTLYLSSDVPTAQAEYQQEKALMPPATVAAYIVTLARVVDLSAGYQVGDWGLEWEDWSCDWRSLAFDLNIEPPSWVLGDLVRATGASGVLFPSLKRVVSDALNLAIYTSAVAADAVTVHDPEGTLPQNQDSWG